MVESTDRFLAPFEAAARKDRGEPRWITALRREAIDRFAALGLPSARNEEWKHTPVGKLLARDLDFGEVGGEPGVPGPLPEVAPEALRVVFVNGRLSGEPDPAGRLPAGVVVASLKSALSGAGDGVPDWLGKCAEFESRSLTALNTAYMTDGALVTVEEGVDVPMPLHLIYVTTGAAAGHAVNLRNLVVAAPGSRLTVVEHWIGEGAAVNNVVTEISVGANAAVRHVKFQEEGRETVHLSSVDVVAGRDARFDHYSVAIGGAAARTEARVRLAGENAECDLFGVYLGRGEQLTDQLTFVEHAVPHGTSRQIYKGVLDGHARGVFNGLVLVRPGAQKTDAKQSNKNLVLSATADAHARPQLDISADDVKCAHGATVGALDPASLFYLRSRGIDSAEARRLLIRAFAGDVIAEMPEGAIRDYAGEIVTRWLSN